ncbi:MAG: YfcE family phosphodiesterase [Nanobdellota archaeon]
MIGIISDTHDNVENVRKAVSVFREREVDFVVHLGDIIAPATIPFFEGLKVYFVKGNNDGDTENLMKKIKEIDGEFTEELTIEHEGKVIKGTHYPHIAREMEADYVLYGHDHTRNDESSGSVRLINPGAHYHNAEGTVALLDVSGDKLEFVEL